MQYRKFKCEHCDDTFWALVAQNVADELLTAACPECKLAARLYQMAIPLLNKRVDDWGFAEWLLAIGVGFTAYQGVKALSSSSS
jgi:hypothetical protein